jgi:hypothetical protein
MRSRRDAVFFQAQVSSPCSGVVVRPRFRLSLLWRQARCDGVASTKVVFDGLGE